MDNLPFIIDRQVLQKELILLRQLRKKSKSKNKRSYILTKSERRLIFEKTDGKCHICGQILAQNKFEADHVKSHSQDGSNKIDNFLPSCKTCNNYRWDYLADELQWILKIGVWARTEIERSTITGNLIADNFIKHEIKREKRRRNPRPANIEFK